MSVPQNTDIKDSRTDFKINTFSNCKKTDVKMALLDSMLKEKIEDACHWCAELICSGYYIDIWEILFIFIGKYIHLGNPKIPLYLKKRFAIFQVIMEKGYYMNDLELRNNKTIRELFAEIICVLTISNKKPSFEFIKIEREEEFDMTKMEERLKSDSIEYSASIMKKDDPVVMTIAINEFSFHVSHKNIKNACYWIEWTIEFDILCKKKKETCFASIRANLPVEKKYKYDIIWIIWDALLYYSKKCNPFINQAVEALHELFCKKYTSGTAKKRKALLYFAVSLITEVVDFKIHLTTNPEIVKNVISNIHIIYKQIKEKEIMVNQTFLGMSEKEINFKQSIQKIEMLNQLEDL